MRTRILSLVMALALCLSTLPTAALAEEVRSAAHNGRRPDTGRRHHLPRGW